MARHVFNQRHEPLFDGAILVARSPSSWHRRRHRLTTSRVSRWAAASESSSRARAAAVQVISATSPAPVVGRPRILSSARFLDLGVGNSIGPDRGRNDRAGDGGGYVTRCRMEGLIATIGSRQPKIALDRGHWLDCRRTSSGYAVKDRSICHVRQLRQGHGSVRDRGRKGSVAH